MAAGVLHGNDLEKLHELCGLPFKEQAVWLLNGFWHDFGEKEAENIWDQVLLCVELNDKDPKGSQLDEMKAHRFLEKIKDTHTVLEVSLSFFFPFFFFFFFFLSLFSFLVDPFLSSSGLNFGR